MFPRFKLALISAMSHAESVYQWGRWQGVFTAAGADSEREMVVEFTSPNGKAAAVSGFWDGGNTWRARFMPDEPGKWRYVTKSSDSGLNGKSGEFDCKKAKSKLKIYQNGSLRVSKNGRYLAHADSPRSSGWATPHGMARCCPQNQIGKSTSMTGRRRDQRNSVRPHGPVAHGSRG